MRRVVLALGLSLSIVATSCGGGGGGRKAAPVANQAELSSTSTKSTGAKLGSPTTAPTGPSVYTSGSSQNPMLQVPPGTYLVGGSCTGNIGSATSVTGTCRVIDTVPGVEDVVAINTFVYSVQANLSIPQYTVAIPPLGPFTTSQPVTFVVTSVANDQAAVATQASIWAMPVQQNTPPSTSPATTR